jgi:hypothetical protein
MNKTFRASLVLIGSIAILFSIGFFLQTSWATQVWPFQSGRLSNIFISSILAAVGAPVIWIGLSGETRAMVGGALNLLVTNAGFAISTFNFYIRSHQSPLLIFGIISLFMVALCIGLIVYSQRKSFLNVRPIPGIVRISFVVFAVILLITAIALIFQRPNTFPWPLSAENSVMYGWIFLGAMCYFLYATIFPVWSNAKGQLIGFLAYDIILIAPFLIYFQGVKPEMLTSLIIYTTVVSYSSLLALYFLFVNPATRFTFVRKSEFSATS